MERYTELSPPGTEAVLVINMNGQVVKRWEGFNNSAGGPWDSQRSEGKTPTERCWTRS